MNLTSGILIKVGGVDNELTLFWIMQMKFEKFNSCQLLAKSDPKNQKHSNLVKFGAIRLSQYR